MIVWHELKFSLNRTGHVIAGLPPSLIVQTPRGSLALSFVQDGTLLLNGQRRFFLYRIASSLKLDVGNPKTSRSGFVSAGNFAIRVFERFFLLTVVIA